MQPPRKALIVVDLQNDFVNGSLPVPDAASIVPVVNRIRDAFDLVVFTKDWHPANHGSFAVNHPGRNTYDQAELDGLPQTLWPVHCVQGERGAELVAGLNMDNAHIFVKGTDPTIDSYSGFADNGHRKSTGLGEFLKSKEVTDVFVCGLATEYCVKATALDAVQLGFKTHVIEDATRGVNRQPGYVANAMDEMRTAGAVITTSSAVIKS